VDEVLGIEEGRLRFAKRKLRVQRCKIITNGSSASLTRVATKRPPAHTHTPAVISTPLPKGDPTLGAKLAHLPKEERKKYKSSDADRVARRLAKKKARMGMEKGELGKTTLKVQGKARSGLVRKKESKPRERSEKNLAMRNMKK
jgi:nucleolar protein 12